ncbi:RNA polymerase sigma factor SigJ [Pseudonocardia eucalypti]|uniref:RNA polymerase sigma factor SigJ n=1 Tax=Pseudonocardia eucalypti TaxID=648755 RepID=A0ABP9QC45_9PSEU|nr:RNA polymerase sigma-70 factor (ECF subfamily) [Pseudonocardia eucalypti]
MDGTDRLTEAFHTERDHLRAVAFRMLGSTAEAEDAVQEAWLRVDRAGPSARAEVRNPTGWLTTVVARICLDMLRSRESRRERLAGAHPPEPVAETGEPVDPERLAVLADSVGPALQVVLDTLAPAERLAFVLHDMFAVSFEEIAPLVGRSTDATRQLASRARRRVRGTRAEAQPGTTRQREEAQGGTTWQREEDTVDRARQRAVVAAFLAAAREGDFTGLLSVLDPEVELRADAVAAGGAVALVRGASTVAGQATAYGRRVADARLVLVDGLAGIAAGPLDRPVRVLTFTVADGMITRLEIVADPERLGRLHLSEAPHA